MNYLALDLGADSGRVILGKLHDGKISLEEIHRFYNKAVAVNGTLRWDVLRLFDELKNGLKRAAGLGIPIESISADSWGVDYVFIKGNEPLVAAPFQYRDSRTDASIERVRKIVPDEAVFAASGIMFISINTLYQLFEDTRSRPEMLAVADKFLNIGDYFNYLFSGVPAAEVSLASTTQLYNPRARSWAFDIADALGIPRKIFPEIVPSGTTLGKIRPEIAAETGLPAATKIVASCSHDTAAAVAAIPAEKGSRWAFLSCGTWSLIGVESPRPFISETVRKANYTNEVGFGHTTRFLKNIVGMWIQQESMRFWKARGDDIPAPELDKLAAAEPELRSHIDPDDERFLKPGDMPKKIAAFCAETSQPIPATIGQTMRCILESLAFAFRKALDDIAALSESEIDTLHVVGGGSRSRLFMQFVANATGRKVVAGPVEGTSCGNILIQAVAAGELSGIDEIRGVVRNSFDVKTYVPTQDRGAWEIAYEKFKNLRPTCA